MMTRIALLMAALLISRSASAGQLGQGAGSSYPTVLDTKTTFTDKATCDPTITTRVCSTAPNDFQDAIVKVETELGASPKGTSVSVKEKIAGLRSYSGATADTINIVGSQVGIGTATPTAWLHLGAGIATKSPLKLSSGINLTTPEAGAIEFDGMSLFFTPAAARKTLALTDSNITGTAANVTGIVAIANGGTNATTAQTAINTLTNVAAATNEQVLTKDTTTGNAIFKAAAGGGSSITSASATVATSESTMSTTYVDLTTVGPSVTITVGASGVLIVGYSANLTNNILGNQVWFDFALSGGNTRAASDTTGIALDPYKASPVVRLGTTARLTGLSATSTTITMKYRVGAGTGTYQDRHLWVMTW